MSLKKNLFVFEDNYYTYNHSFDIDNSEAKMRLISSSDSSMVFLLKSIGNQNRFRYYNLCFSTQIIGDNFQIGIDSINAVPGIYLNHLNCDIVQELSKEDVKIKCLNETGRAYDKLVVKKKDLYFHNIDYSWSWELEHNLSEQDSIKLMNSEPGFYYQGIKCIILEELSEIDVKIKYHTETGRGYYRKIVRRTDIAEIK